MTQVKLTNLTGRSLAVSFPMLVRLNRFPSPVRIIFYQAPGGAR